MVEENEQCVTSFPIARLQSLTLFLLVIDQGATISSDVGQRVRELEEYTTALDKGIADLHTLRKLIVLCHRNPCQAPLSPPTSPSFPKTRHVDGVPMSPASPSPLAVSSGRSGLPAILGDIWAGGTRSERLFSALCTFLQPGKVRIFSSFSYALYH